MFRFKYIKHLKSENKHLTSRVQYYIELERQLNASMIAQRKNILALEKDNYRKSSLLASQESSIKSLTTHNKQLQMQVEALLQERTRENKYSLSYHISYLPQASMEDIIAAYLDEQHSYYDY